jgi:hypothetical protein
MHDFADISDVMRFDVWRRERSPLRVRKVECCGSQQGKK